MPLDSSQYGGISSSLGSSSSNIRTTPTLLSASSSSSSVIPTTAATTTTTLRSSCICGAISLQINNIQLDTPSSDCHCSSCRRYHTSAFASYLQVSSDCVQWNFATNQESSLMTYMDTCQELGPVKRFGCQHCGTKLATQKCPTNEDKLTTTMTNKQQSPPQDDDDLQSLLSNDDLFINMGPLEEETIPDSLSLNWQFHRQSWPTRQKQSSKATTTKPNSKTKQTEEGAIWLSALPQWDDLDYKDRPGLRTIHGGCACGRSQYTIRCYTPPSELQHCYCRLCRQCSGSAFQTWVPIPQEFFSWNIKHQHDGGEDSLQTNTNLEEEPDFIRTTAHGGRHMCRNCRGVLTIVYEEDEGATIWPAAGGFYDESLPLTQQGMNAYLNRVVHIGCSWKQSWYSIPYDGMDRLDMAS
jgi:hypothetical protein